MSKLAVEELRLWLASPVTKKFGVVLKKSRLLLMESLASNSESFSDVSKALGRCEGLQAAIDLINVNLDNPEEVDELVSLYHRDLLTNEQNNE